MTNKQVKDLIARILTDRGINFTAIKSKTPIGNNMFIYRILEWLGGENGTIKLLPYRITQGLKMFVLMYLIK
jgi:hypothetical protein